MSAAPRTDPARLFVAVTLGAAAHEQVSALLARVAALVTQPDQRARVTAGDDAHITLRFLGDVTRSRVRALEDGLSRAFDGVHGGRVSCGPIEVLPKHAWLRVSEDAPFLAALATRIDHACVAAGVRPNDEPALPFRPHVTLVRLDRAPETTQVALRALESGVICSDRIEHVTLFESLPHPRPAAARYATLATFPLQAQAVEAAGAAR